MSADHQNRIPFQNPVVEWIDYRLPIFTMMTREYGTFPTPKNFNYFWNFGAIALVMLITMILTGVTLAMHYTANTHYAFDSVERVMRDVNYGWLIRYIHMNGASFFFIAVYIHIFRGMYYGSFKRPREIVWMVGVLIFLLMMATAFMGYVLPWGQMSFWGATVITNLFGAIPVIGKTVVEWMWGGFSVDNPTLNRFFALHFLLPFVIAGVIGIHIWALHVHGSNNPTGLDVKGPQDTIGFHPYYTVKDSFGVVVFLLIFVACVFFFPNYLGHTDNYIPANPLVTPAHIVPEWYFLPFYAMLRAINFDIGIPFTDIVFVEAKLGGVLTMFGSIAILFVLPWLDTHPVRSAAYRPRYKIALLLFVVAVFTLGKMGGALPDVPLIKFTDTIAFTTTHLSQIATLYYFGFFLVILPYLSRHEMALPMPASIHEAVLKNHNKHKGAV